jgi:hypothetical protein
VSALRPVLSVRAIYARLRTRGVKRCGGEREAYTRVDPTYSHTGDAATGMKTRRRGARPDRLRWTATMYDNTVCTLSCIARERGLTQVGR